MRTVGCVTGLMVAGVICGCGVKGETDMDKGNRPDGTMTIPLSATGYNAGEIGTAILIPRGNSTDVKLEVSGVPNYVTRPVYLYAYIHEGVCGNLSPKPAYALTDHVLAHSLSRPTALDGVSVKGPFTVSNTAPVTLEKLRLSPHAIKVQTAPADGGFDIFCGNIV